MIHNFENDSDTITCIIDDVTGLDVQVNVSAEYDHGQAYKPPTSRDPIGQAPFSASVNDMETTVYIGEVDGEDYFVKVELSREQEAEIEQAIIDYRNEEDR